ncbi:hypothetical protein R50073_48280 [Maricurvus nonylphenolicus]|uniref:SMI1/KNR4 family protein n=1 Tax=Maricurvus nonylphenolicus TaxID=1008307 RepID=UPI0036F1E5B9
MKKLEVFHDSGEIDPLFIDEFERDFEIKFPSTYRDLIARHNELIPEFSFFDFMSLTDNSVSSRDITFFGFGELSSESGKIENNQDHDVYGHKEVVCFGCSANGDYICFDYRSCPESDNPPVVLMFHDYQGEDGKLLVCPVADDFESFLNLLRPSTD